MKANITVESATQLREEIDRAVETALTPPTGPVRLGIPRGMLAESVDSPAANVSVARVSYETDGVLASATDDLAGAERPLVYVGGGAAFSGRSRRRRRTRIRSERPGRRFIQGKGRLLRGEGPIPRLTGGDLSAGARAVFEAADVVIALGTNFDGPNTANWSIPMGETLVHVDLDPDEPTAADFASYKTEAELTSF